MSKLADCIAKINADASSLTVTDEDTASLREQSFTLQAQGMSEGNSEAKAARALLASLMGERRGFTEQVASLGGVVPRRSEGRTGALVEGRIPRESIGEGPSLCNER